jgi:predicted membrane protein
MSTTNRSFWPGVILLVLGVLFLLDSLDVASFGHVMRTYWPVILIIMGIAFLMRRQRVWLSSEQSKSVGGVFEGTETPTDTISETSIFGNTYVKPTSRNFKGGSVSTVFGNVELNLASAELATGEQHLGVHGVFGGLRITLPKDIGVMVRGNCLFGEVTVFNQKRGGIGSEVLYKSENYDSAERRLNITASQVFGDVRIW